MYFQYLDFLFAFTSPSACCACHFDLITKIYFAYVFGKLISFLKNLIMLIFSRWASENIFFKIINLLEFSFYPFATKLLYINFFDFISLKLISMDICKNSGFYTNYFVGLSPSISTMVNTFTFIHVSKCCSFHHLHYHFKCLSILYTWFF